MLNKNIILNTDCVQGMANLASNSVQMILTDPPYLVNYNDRQGRSVVNDNLNNGDWLTPAFSQMYRVLDNNRYAVVFYGWNEVDKFIIAWRKAGFRVVGHFVFYKKYASNARNNKKHMAYRHECAYLLTKGYPQPHEVLPSVMGWNYTANKWHPTQKPVDLLLKLMRALCPTAGIVLDPFMGSGSTAMACIQSQTFDYLGYELDPHYFNLAIDRIGQQQGSSANNNHYHANHHPRQVVNPNNPLPQATHDNHDDDRSNIKPRYKYNPDKHNPQTQHHQPITPSIPQVANEDYFTNRANAQGGYYG